MLTGFNRTRSGYVTPEYLSLTGLPACRRDKAAGDTGQTYRRKEQHTRQVAAPKELARVIRDNVAERQKDCRSKPHGGDSYP